MTSIDYEQLKFLDGIRPDDAKTFESDLEVIKSFSKENLSDVIDLAVNKYITGVPFDEDSLKDYSKKIGESALFVRHTIKFVLYALGEAAERELSVEDFENDIALLGLDAHKDVLKDKYIQYKDNLIKLSKEKSYFFYQIYSDCEWRIYKNLSVSTGKVDDSAHALISIEYYSIDKELKKLSFGLDIDHLKVLIMNLQRCLNEAKKWPEKK